MTTRKMLALVRIAADGTEQRIEADSDEYDAATGHLRDVLDIGPADLRLRLLMTLAGRPVEAAGAKWKFEEGPSC